MELSLDWFEFGTLLERLEGGDLDVAFTMAFELLDRPHLRRRTPWDGGVCMCCWAAKAPWPEQSSCT